MAAWGAGPQNALCFSHHNTGVVSKSFVSLSITCSRPPHKAQELKQIHMETQPGDLMGSLLGERRSCGTLNPSEIEITPDPGLSHPILHRKFPLFPRTPWVGKMSSGDHRQVSPWTRDPGVRSCPLISSWSGWATPVGVENLEFM